MIKSYIIFVYIITASIFIECAINKKYNLSQCYPKSDNFTLCYGPRFLQQYSSFAQLLRYSKDSSYIHANIWMILLHTQCHEDLQLLLCSMYSPLCTKGHKMTQINVCKEFCQDVQQSCLPRMKIYGFEWSSMINCQVLPSRKDTKCIDLTNKHKIIEPKKKKIIRQREDRSLNDQCNVCHRKADMQTIAQQFCGSPLIIKAKISALYPQSSKDIFSLKLHWTSRVWSKSKLVVSLDQLKAEIRCKCRMLESRKIRSNNAYATQSYRPLVKGKYLLMGDLKEDGRFIIRFLVKLRRKNYKLRYLLLHLKINRGKFCRQGVGSLMSYIDKNSNEIKTWLTLRNQRRRHRKKMKQKLLRQSSNKS